MIACETLFKTFHVQSPAFLALQHSGFHRCTTLGLWATRQRMRSSLLSYTRLKCCSFDQFLGELRLYSNRSACYVKLKKFDKDGQLDGEQWQEWNIWNECSNGSKYFPCQKHVCLSFCYIFVVVLVPSFQITAICGQRMYYTDRTLCLTSTWHQLIIASSEITFKQ